MNPNDEGSDAGDPVGSRPLSRWVIAAPSIALVVGMLLGGALIWVTTHNTGPGAEDSRDEPEASPSPGTAVVVPNACLQAADSVREATELMRGGLDDIRAFRAERIIELLDDLEDLDNQARAQAQTCADVHITDAPHSSPADPTIPTTPASESSTQVPFTPSDSPVEPPSS